MNTVLPANSSHPGLVSIVTPCHNAAPFVAETIESVAAQTYPHIEHILVDDGSTDGSWEVIERYTSGVTALRLEQNRGGSHARNRGAERARGDFLMFLDADDLIAQRTIEALVATIRERPGHIAFCSWKLLRQVHGRWITSPAGVAFPTPSGDHLRGWLLGSWVPPCAVLWCRTEYERTGGWDETLCVNDDGDLTMRALAQGVRLVRAKGGEAYYRAHDPTRLSLSGNMFSIERFRSSIRVFEKLTQELEHQGRLDAYATPLGVAYHRLALVGFRLGFTEQARECERRGEHYAGRQAVSRTRLGRLLSRLVGLERKERIADALARFGLRTRRRAMLTELRRRHGGGTA
jgi:glycosyltransferase involved in cell wall biosynthesis